MWPKLASWIHKHEALWFVLIAVVLLRIPSLFEPYWYGDEGIYLTIGQAVRRGLELYRGIHDNKPPLLYLVAALAGGNLFWFKFLALIASIGSTIIFSALAKKWWGNTRGYVLSLILFALVTTLPSFEGNIANAENFFILFTTLAFYLLFAKSHKYYLVLGGLALGIAGLFKMPAILEAAVWPLYWLITRDREWFKKSVVFGIATLTPLTLSILYFASRGTLAPYLIAVGLQNVPYLASWHISLILIGTLSGRLIVLVFLVGVTWALRKRVDKKVLLLALWFLIALFAALLSGRPYPHYLLQLAPVFALAVGYVWNRKNIFMPAVLVVLVIGCIKLFGFHPYPNLAYYGNFLSWITNRQDKASYFHWFNPNVNRDYRIAATIMQASASTDQIFVWGDEPVIYALSKRLPVGKYTVRYHIQDFGAQAQTLQTLKANPPRVMVTFDHDASLPGLPTLLSSGYVLEAEVDNAQIYRRIRE